MLKMKTAMTVALAVSVFALTCTASEVVPCVAASVMQKCAAPETAIARAVPVERQSPRWAGPGFWDRRHRAKLEEIASGPKEYDFVFVGDSITHNWEGWNDPVDIAVVTKAYERGTLKFPNGPGRKVWEEMKKEFRLLNLGCAGDTTQNVLWRIEHGEMDGYRTRGVALMIGTNNGGSPEDVAAGIREILRKIQEKQPDATIVLMPIFPAGAKPTSPRRTKNNRVNELIRPFADGTRIVWLDFNGMFLEPDGSISLSMMPDYLHPIERGYSLWRAAIEPVMRKVKGER